MSGTTEPTPDQWSLLNRWFETASRASVGPGLRSEADSEFHQVVPEHDFAVKVPRGALAPHVIGN